MRQPSLWIHLQSHFVLDLWLLNDIDIDDVLEILAVWQNTHLQPNFNWETVS